MAKLCLSNVQSFEGSSSDLTTYLGHCRYNVSSETTFHRLQTKQVVVEASVCCLKTTGTHNPRAGPRTHTARSNQFISKQSFRISHANLIVLNILILFLCSRVRFWAWHVLPLVIMAKSDNSRVWLWEGNRQRHLIYHRAIGIIAIA